MAANDVVPSNGECCCCDHKTCTRGMCCLGLILAIGLIIIMSKWLRASGEHYEFLNELGHAVHGVHITVLIGSIFELFCNLFLLIGNEKGKTGFFESWEVMAAVHICVTLFILVKVAIAGNHGLGFLLFVAICIKGGMFRSVQHRRKEITAVREYAGTAVDEPQVRIPLDGPVTLLAYRQAAGFDEVSASPANNRTGFARPGDFSPGNQGSIAPMGQNEAVFVHWGATTTPNVQAAFGTFNTFVPTNQPIPAPYNTAWPNVGEDDAPPYPTAELPPPYESCLYSQGKRMW